MPDLDWDAPLNADGRERPAALRSALGLDAPELDAFLGLLEAELSADAWGFERLTELEGEARALVSDQLLSAAYGIQDALTDASLARRGVEQHTGPNGIPISRAEDSLNDMLSQLELRRNIAGFFDSVGTCLDCLAAVLVVVSRAPISVQKADFGRLRGLDPEARFKGLAEIPDQQRQLWRDLSAALSAAATAGPVDWLDWSLEMRNALTHRGRVTNIYLPRRISTQLFVPPMPEPQSLYRYDAYLRRRPWLPEIEGMLTANGIAESVLDEPAEVTIDGLHTSLVAFTELLIAFAGEHWQEAQQGLVAPLERWLLPTPPEIDFAGADPRDKVPLSGAIGGINQEHMKLAEKLRLGRQ